MSTTDQPFVSFTKNDAILFCVSLIFPPLAVYLRQGFMNKDFLINLLLSLFFGIPGCAHAFYIIYTTSILRADEPEIHSSRLEEGLNQHQEPTPAYEPPVANELYQTYTTYEAPLIDDQFDNTDVKTPFLSNEVQTSMDNKMQH